MSIYSSNIPLPPIPDNLLVPQFFLWDNAGPSRPRRPSDVPYFIDDASGRRVFYEEVHHRTYGLANALSVCFDFKSGDVACLVSPNHVDYPIAIWAVHTLGGIVTPANPSYTTEELVYQLSKTKTKVIFAHPVCFEVAIAAAAECGISKERIVLFNNDKLLHSSSQTPFHTVDRFVKLGASKPENYKALRLAPGEAKTRVAFLSFSSGTTGKPKAVKIPHYAVIANTIQKTVHFHLDEPDWPDKRVSPGDVGMGVLPFFHIYGLVVTLHFMLYAGASVVVIPKFNFADYLRSIERHKITHLFMVPPQVVLMSKHPAAKGLVFDHVKMCISGAAPLSAELMHQLRTNFPNAAIGQGYGMTETATSVCFLQPDQKMGTVGGAGILLPGIKAKVVKLDGTLAGDGESGELVVTGPAMAIGYHENPEASAETFVDGWVRTGDEVIVRDLEVFIVDRIKELIKVRGFQVAPAELEAHLLQYPDVADACVVGVPDDFSGEIPFAFVSLAQETVKRVKGDTRAETALKAAICKHVADGKVQYKHLTGGVCFIDSIPKNPSGKILRRLLRDEAKAIATKSVGVSAKL